MEYLKALLGLGVQPRGLNILFSIAEDPEPHGRGCQHKE